MAKITISRVIADSRPNKGVSGMVIGEHIFGDGQVWGVQCHALAGEDAQERLDGMIPAREAQRVVDDALVAERAVEESAVVKSVEYIKSVPDQDLADAGFTPEEIEKIKGGAVAAAASAHK